MVAINLHVIVLSRFAVRLWPHGSLTSSHVPFPESSMLEFRNVFSILSFYDIYNIFINQKICVYIMWIRKCSSYLSLKIHHEWTFIIIKKNQNEGEMLPRGSKYGNINIKQISKLKVLVGIERYTLDWTFTSNVENKIFWKAALKQNS